jgi:hypothetical protein
MEAPQTHCYAAGTVTLLWKCYKVHRSCYHGKPNMSQYIILWPQRGSRASLVRLAQDTFNHFRILRTKFLFNFSP